MHIEHAEGSYAAAWWMQLN